MTETLRGNLHAIEQLLGQLFALDFMSKNDPQELIKENLSLFFRQIRQSVALNEDEKAVAQGTVFRVMQVASYVLEDGGHGPSFEIEGE